MHEDAWGQATYALRFDWGPVGAARARVAGGVLVIVDVLSFTTAVTVAVDRGTIVYPAPWRGDAAVKLARDVDGVLAVGRLEATRDQPWSLSPAALLAAPVTQRLVLPSPNGSAIAAAAGGLAVAASLRNAGAVARWLASPGAGSVRPVTVIAAGERWPDGSLRPSLEDHLGAGAVLSALATYGTWHASPEADAARALYEGTTSVADAVRSCASGRELAEAGFAVDVDLAVEVSSSNAVPVLTN